MSRLARLDAPGALHHIMIRGIERRNIFRIKVDYEVFLKRLAKLLPETQTCCYVWTLMSNHAHILSKNKLEQLIHPSSNVQYTKGI